jgi:hypothetical protein
VVVSAAVLTITRRLAAVRGITGTVSVFVYDYIVVSPSREDAEALLRLLRFVAAMVGFATPDAKVQGPSRSVKFLGLSWSSDGTSAAVHLHPDFLAKLRDALDALRIQLLRRGAAPLGLVRSVRGLCLWAARCFPEARAHVRGFGRALYAPRPSRRGYVSLRPRRTQADVLWWLSFLYALPAPRALRPSGTVVTVVSDAGEQAAAALVEAGSARWCVSLEYPPWLPSDSTSREVLGAAVGVLVARRALGDAEPLRVRLFTDSSASA